MRLPSPLSWLPLPRWLTLPPWLTLPMLAAAFVPLLVVCGLTWPLVLHLGDHHMVTAWGDSHVWILDLSARRLLEGTLLEPTLEAGYPLPRHLRAVGGVALLPFLLLQPLLGSLAAGSLTHLLAFPLTGVVTFFALGRLTDAPPWVRAATASAYALGPTVLSTLGMGELSNTQAWVLPAFLWATDLACPLDAARRPAPRALLGVAAVGLVGGLSSPYYALALPLVAGAWAVVGLWRRPEAPARRLLLVAGPVVVLGLSLLPVRAWFDADLLRGAHSLVEPAPRAFQGDPGGRPLPDPPSVATPQHLLLGPTTRPRSPWQSDHVAYLGIVLVAAAGLQLRRKGRGRALGVALTVGGVVLALGPWLAAGGEFLSVAGRGVPTPVRLLELFGYPTRDGGLYFRFAVVAELGLVVLLTAGLSRHRRGAALAWLVASLHLVDTGQSTWADGAGRWPVRVEPVADRGVLQAMAPVGPITPEAADGAVLELPLQGGTDAWMAQEAVLRALFHRRPTTGVLRDLRPHERTLRDLVAAAFDGPDPAADLRAAGFRYVLLPRDRAVHSQYPPFLLDAALGPRWHDGDLLVWDLGATSLVPLSLSPPPPKAP